MAERYYNIHDIVKFKVVSSSLFERQFSNIYESYKNFETEKIDNPDFNVYLGKFTPSNHDCHIIQDKYYIKENYFYCTKDSYKVIKWEFEMAGFEGDNTTVRIHSDFIGYMFMAGIIIDFLIRFKMNEKGYPIVHASCVSKDNHGFLFSARSGGGKTTIALNLVENGFKFLGDDFSILHNNAVLSFLSPLNIFTYNLSPVIRRNFGVKNKVILGLKELLYKMTLGYIKIFTMINPCDVFPDLIADKSKLDGIFLIIPKEEFYIEKIGKDELIEHLIMNQKLNSLFFLKYISEYSYIFPESNLSTHWDRYKENLKMNLPDNIPVYTVEVPQKYDKKIFEKIWEMIPK